MSGLGIVEVKVSHHESVRWERRHTFRDKWLDQFGQSWQYKHVACDESASADEQQDHAALSRMCET